MCYKKYLGPDWKPDYDMTRVSTVISNHSSFLDVPLHASAQIPSIIAKDEVKKTPGIGPIAVAAGCVFVKRTDKKNKQIVQDLIIKKQAESEADPELDPLVVHVEGGTTNGKGLINFKRGAFVGLKSIWPKVHVHNSFFQSPSSGVVDGVPLYLVTSCLPFSWVTKLELPVFRPNDFFFQHHQMEGEEKWQTYARVMRDIMSDVSGIPKIDA